MRILNKNDWRLQNISREQLQPVVVIGALVLCCLVFTLINPNFLSWDNFHSILLLSVSVGLVAIGECCCLIAGYFDMTATMVASLSGLFVAYTMRATGSGAVTLVVVIAWGLTSGLIAGVLVSYLKMSAFITTYALSSLYRGVIWVLTDGNAVGMVDEIFEPITKWGSLRVFGFLQFPILVLIVVYILVALFMRFSRLGRSIFMVGSNQKCAHICGINVHGVQVFIYMLSGVLASLSGLLYAARISQASAFLNELTVMEAIAAAIVGGTSMSGGKGSIGLTFVGVLILYVIKNGLVMADVPDYYQYIVVGLILFAAVLLQVERKKN